MRELNGLGNWATEPQGGLPSGDVIEYQTGEISGFR